MIRICSAPSKDKHLGLLSLNNNTHHCSLGKTGITSIKKEGDNATPMGIYKCLYGFYRADRVKLPQTLLPMIPINRKMGWCDAPSSPNYNQLVSLPYAKSCETLMRDDRLYDICLVMNYNFPKHSGYLGRNKGSAIFFHQTKHIGALTQGCIAVEPKLMLQLLPKISTQTIIQIVS